MSDSGCLDARYLLGSNPLMGSNSVVTSTVVSGRKTLPKALMPKNFSCEKDWTVPSAAAKHSTSVSLFPRPFRSNSIPT